MFPLQSLPFGVIGIFLTLFLPLVAVFLLYEIYNHTRRTAAAAERTDRRLARVEATLLDAAEDATVEADENPTAHAEEHAAGTGDDRPETDD